MKQKIILNFINIKIYILSLNIQNTLLLQKENKT